MIDTESQTRAAVATLLSVLLEVDGNTLHLYAPGVAVYQKKNLQRPVDGDYFYDFTVVWDDQLWKCASRDSWRIIGGGEPANHFICTFRYLQEFKIFLHGFLFPANDKIQWNTSPQLITLNEFVWGK